MKDYEFYVKKNRKLLRGMIDKALNDGEAFALYTDCVIGSEKDLETVNVKSSFKRKAKQMATQEFKLARQKTMKMISPEKDVVVAGVELKGGIPIPAFFEDIKDQGDVETKDLVVGLIQHLHTDEKENREYYKKILKGLYPEIVKADTSIIENEEFRKVVEGYKSEE